MRQTERTGTIPENTFTETTTGDAPCSIELTRNAKGDYQWQIKLYLADDSALQEFGPAIAQSIDADLRRRFLAAPQEVK